MVLLVRSVGCRGLRLFSHSSFVRSAAASAAAPSGGVSNTPPDEFKCDGSTHHPDSKWNLSPAVRRLLDRRLLDEPSNPLALLKQRIVNHVHKEYRKPGNRSPVFTICDREPRVVSVFDNFDSLLTPKDHVSRRASDTYYVNADACLRAHTSAHQHKLVKQGLDAFIVVGDVYRRDEIDRTHYPAFHQVEGVRLYSPDQLFNAAPGEELPLFEKSPTARTTAKQETLTQDTTKALEIRLKQTLESLCDNLFGADCEKRWVDAYFPFTNPSWELEVLYEGKWLEVLGCGVMEQKLLESAGVTDKVGWAFGLGLERLAMVLYGVPDIRLFWSKDTGFLSQFAGKTPEDNFKYKPVSVHPQVLFDVSFWLPEGVEFGDMTANVFDLIRSVGGDLIEQVTLKDEFTNKKQRRSQTFGIVYRSHSRALTKEEVNVVHKEIERGLEAFGVQMR